MSSGAPSKICARYAFPNPIKDAKPFTKWVSFRVCRTHFIKEDIGPNNRLKRCVSEMSGNLFKNVKFCSTFLKSLPDTRLSYDMYVNSKSTHFEFSRQTVLLIHQMALTT